MKALIYCRVSTKEQALSGYSLEQQKNACIRYVEDNGFILGEIFMERGESAKTTDRSKFKIMLRTIEKNHKDISALVIWKVDRLTRDLYDYKYLELRLMQKGVMIHSVSEPNEMTAVGKLSRNMTAALAQFDNDQKSERTIATMKQALKDGRWLWKEPLGYKRVVENNRSIMVIDEATAFYVHKAFDLAETNNYTKTEILRRLHEMGHTGLKIDKLTNILENPLYIGKIRSSWFPELIDGIHQPIISKRQFNNVQKVLAERRNGGINKVVVNPLFPLKKTLLCGKCGAKITGSKSKGAGGKKYAYYHCYSKEKCSVRTAKNLLEEKFYEYLKSFTLKDKVLEATIANIKTEIEEFKNNYSQELKNINSQLSLLKTRKKKLIDLMLDDAINKTDGKESMTGIDNEILFLEGQISDIKIKNIDFDAALESFKYFCSNISEWWLNTTDIKTKERLQSIIFPNKTYWDGKKFRTGKTPLFMRISELSEGHTRKWRPRADSNSRPFP